MTLADPHLSLDGALHQENILPGSLNLNFYSLLSENKLYTQLKQGLNETQTQDLCDTSAMIYRLSYQANWELATVWVLNIPVDGEDTSEYMLTAETQGITNCESCVFSESR